MSNKNGRPRTPNGIWARQKLRKRILEKYPTLRDFCKDINCTDVQLYYVMSGKQFGSLKFWQKVQKTLDIPPRDVFLYQYNNQQQNT